jgi:hypothetical protein
MYERVWVSDYLSITYLVPEDLLDARGMVESFGLVEEMKLVLDLLNLASKLKYPVGIRGMIVKLECKIRTRDDEEIPTNVT